MNDKESDGSGEFALRLLEIGDLAELQAWFSDMELARRLSYPSPEWFAYVSTSNTARCWVAVGKRGRLVAQIQVDRSGDETGFLDLAVLPSLRGKGLGAAVLNAFIAGPGKAYSVLEGRISPDNAASLACLRRCGFDQWADLDEEGFIKMVRSTSPSQL